MHNVYICVYSFHLTIELNKWSTIAVILTPLYAIKHKKKKEKKIWKEIDMWWHLQHFLRCFFFFNDFFLYIFHFAYGYFVISDRHIAAVPSLTSLNFLFSSFFDIFFFFHMWLMHSPFDFAIYGGVQNHPYFLFVIQEKKIVHWPLCM